MLKVADATDTAARSNYSCGYEKQTAKKVNLINWLRRIFRVAGQLTALHSIYEINAKLFNLRAYST